MRDIAKIAGVVPSHVVSAFGASEELYAAVLVRRVDDALAGNVCRCMGYHQIVAAVLATSEDDG